MPAQTLLSFFLFETLTLRQKKVLPLRHMSSSWQLQSCSYLFNTAQSQNIHVYRFNSNMANVNSVDTRTRTELLIEYVDLGFSQRIDERDRWMEGWKDGRKERKIA